MTREAEEPDHRDHAPAPIAGPGAAPAPGSAPAPAPAPEDAVTGPDDREPDYVPSGFSAIVGARFDEVGPTRVAGWVEITDDHLQPYGIVHGGVYAALVEEAASYGSATRAMEDGKVTVGVSNTTEFLRPFRTGRLDIVAEALHQGRTQQLWEVRITDPSSGKLVAIGRLRTQNLDVAP